MSLAELIRGKRSAGVATVTLATVATHKGKKKEIEGWNRASVATVAPVTVATATEQQKECCGWLIHFGDRNPLTVAFSPAATHAEVLTFYPDSFAAEPIHNRPEI